MLSMFGIYSINYIFLYLSVFSFGVQLGYERLFAGVLGVQKINGQVYIESDNFSFIISCKIAHFFDERFFNKRISVVTDNTYQY